MFHILRHLRNGFRPAGPADPAPGQAASANAAVFFVAAATAPSAGAGGIWRNS